MRPSKLEVLPLETLSSQVLEFEGKARANPIGGPFRCFFLVKLLVLPTNVRLGWKVTARYKHSSLFGLVISNEEKKLYNIDTRNVNGGLTMSFPTDTGHSMQLQATHRPVPPDPAQSASVVQVQPSLRQGSEGSSLCRASVSAMQTCCMTQSWPVCGSLAQRY
jgi:hypothetical protein